MTRGDTAVAVKNAKFKDYADFIKKVGYGQLEGVDVTHDGYPLSVKESQFISEFIGTGSVPKALEQSGLSWASLSGKEYIPEEISWRLEQLKKETIADADEIMQYLTRVMRGEEKDQFGLDAPLSERTNAAKELAKRVMDVVEEVQVQPEIKVTLNFEGI